MYGLADRIARHDRGASDTVACDGLPPVVPLVPRGTVMVIDRDPAMLQLVQRCLHEVCHIAVARDAAEVLEQLPWSRPDVLLLDMGLEDDQIAAIADRLAAGCTDSIPVVMIDPAEALNGDDLRSRVRAAMRVNGREYLGGGLRGRMAA